ncbi:MAG TPA: hypothetical protein PKA37_12435, partial [Planctomycetota bacterium]|nr:hypothetical protein [Planctomycetota bacterium]
MSLKPVINVKCPCCNRVLEIDVESQRVMSHREGPHLILDAKDGEDPLAVAKRAAEEQRKKAADRFARAQGDLKKTSDRLDALFRDA